MDFTWTDLKFEEIFFFTWTESSNTVDSLLLTFTSAMGIGTGLGGWFPIILLPLYGAHCLSWTLGFTIYKFDEPEKVN